MGIDIDIRKEFKTLIREYSANLVFQKSSKYIRCSCYNELHKSGDPECTKCNGAGKLVALERHKGIIETPDAGSSKNSLKSTEIGQAVTSGIKIYVEHTVQVKPKDLIFTVGFRGNTMATLHNVYEVTNTEPVRGDNGRIELIVIYTSAVPFKMDLAERVMNKFRGRELQPGRCYYV